MLPASTTYRPTVSVRVRSVSFAALTVESMCGILLEVGIMNDSLVMVAMAMTVVILYVPALSESGWMLYRFRKRVPEAKPPRCAPKNKLSETVAVNGRRVSATFEQLHAHIRRP